MSPSRTPIYTVKSPLSEAGSQQAEYPEIFKPGGNSAIYWDAVNKKVSQYVVKQVNLGKSGRVRCGERTLELLLRDDFVCMGCRRRKRIGLVFCWVCWDKGCPAKTTSSKRTYFRSPYTFAGLSISSWLGIYSEHTLEDEAKECWNRKLKLESARRV